MMLGSLSSKSFKSITTIPTMMKSHIQPPKTKLEDYLEYRKEVTAEVRLAAVRSETAKNRRIQYLTLIKKIDNIYQNYKDKLHSKDMHYFNGLPDLDNFLREQLELKEYKVKEIIRHEKKHANKAWNLGYVVNGFGCIILRTDKTRNKMTYATFTRIKYDKIISLDDLREMAKAPAQLSYSDRLHP